MVRIGDVCKLMTGGTPSRSRPEFFENGTIKWLVSGDINQVEIFDCDGRITEEAMKSSNTKILPMNSVMIALNGQGKTRGSVALLRTLATCNQSLVSISPLNESELLPEFLFHNLRMRYQELRRMTGDDGNDRRGLNMILIRDIQIPLPSLERQRAIVEKLDSAFAEIDLLKYDVERELETVENLMNGLIDDQFHNLEGIAQESRLENYCTKIQDGSHFSPKVQISEPREGWFPYLTSKNIRNNYVDLRGITFIDSHFHEGIYQRCNPELGDLLLTKDGVNTGNITINSLDFPFSLLSSVCIIKVKKDLLDATYLKFYLQSSVGRRAILGDMTGAAIKRIILRTIKNLNIPIVALVKQQEIGKVLEACLMNINAYRNGLNRKQTLVEDLRQSLLNDAFSQRESVS